MPGGGQTLGGPVIVILQFLRWVVPAAAVLLALDAIRRPASHFPGRFQSTAKVAWAVSQAVFVLVVLIAVSTPSSMRFAVAALLLSIVAFALQIAYLLRVVFPSPARLEKRREATVHPGEPTPSEPEER